MGQLEGQGRAVITASRATEYAFEADDLTSANAHPSMFTGAIIEGLETGRADANGDGLVTVDELYDYVYDAVRGKVYGQTPGRWIHVEGDLVVARNPTPPVRAAVLTPEVHLALQSDLALQRLGAVMALEEWYQGDDPARQLAAGTAREQLAMDHDERVKAAATAALGSTSPVGRQAPSAEAPPIPITAPRARDDSHYDATRDVADVRPLSPTEGRADDGILRTAGWLALAGGLAVLLGDHSADDGAWYRLGAFVFFALAGYAAFCLLRRAASSGTGLAVLAGLAPVALAEGLVGIGTSFFGDVGHGPGWLLAEAGLGLLTAAGLLSLLRLRRYLPMPPPLGPDSWSGQLGMALTALLVGGAASYGSAKVDLLRGDSLFGIARAGQNLVVRLLILTALSCIVWPWARTRPGRIPWLFAGAVLLVLLSVAYFLRDEVGRNPDTWMFAAGFAAFSVGAATVPMLSTLLMPRRYGFALLAAWVGAGAAWLPSHIVAKDVDGGLLAAALAAAGALAAVLAVSERRSATRSQSPTPAPQSHAPGPGASQPAV